MQLSINGKHLWIEAKKFNKEKLKRINAYTKFDAASGRSTGEKVSKGKLLAIYHNLLTSKFCPLGRYSISIKNYEHQKVFDHMT